MILSHNFLKETKYSALLFLCQIACWNIQELNIILESKQTCISDIKPSKLYINMHELMQQTEGFQRLCCMIHWQWIMHVLAIRTWWWGLAKHDKKMAIGTSHSHHISIWTHAIIKLIPWIFLFSLLWAWEATWDV